MQNKDNIQLQILSNKEWCPIDIENLRKGDIIREFINYKLLKDEHGCTVRKCTTDAYEDEDNNGSWNIKSIGIKLNENMEEIKPMKTLIQNETMQRVKYEYPTANDWVDHLLDMKNDGWIKGDYYKENDKYYQIYFKKINN